MLNNYNHELIYDGVFNKKLHIIKNKLALDSNWPVLIMLLPSLLNFGSAFAWNINGYAPMDSECPARNALRRANGSVSSAEFGWLKGRDSRSHEALLDWLEESNLTDFDARSFLNDISHDGIDTIRIGLAFSGGGFRAMLGGAGMLSALDINTPGSRGPGGLGGLLQASTYVTGLSGGSWLVSSLAMNNWTSIPRLQASNDVWNFASPFNPGDSTNRIMSFFRPSWDISIVEDVASKMNAGFPITISDVWGRFLSAQLFGGPGSGNGLLWSDLLSYKSMKDFSAPLPILVADGYDTYPTGNSSFSREIYKRAPSNNQRAYDTRIPLNSTVIEMTPFEIGSYDPTLSAFVETRYLGSSMSGSSSTFLNCVTGMDNVGYLVASSSALFNKMIDEILEGTPLRSLYNSILNAFSSLQLAMMTVIKPSPFQGLSWVSRNIRDSDMLKLVDGGEDGQDVPYVPLVRPERNLDLVLGFDFSTNTPDNWPDGTAIRTTYERMTRTSQGDGVGFPQVPPPNIMVSRGYNKQPAFFGCNHRNSNPSYSGPIVGYIPNSYKSFPSNQNTFKLTYNAEERDGMINNGYNVMTLNNGTRDPEWRSCLACTVILRQQQRNGDTPTEQCSRCLDKYCYS